MRARTEAKIDEGISTLALLYLLFFCLTGSIAAADWTDGLGVLIWAAVAGITFGWLLAGIQRLRGFLAHLAAALLAVPVTAVIVASLFPNTLTFHEKLFVLQDRTITWLHRILSGASGSDNLIFVLQLTLLMWLLAYSAAWFIFRRHQVWGAILPSGIAFLFNLFYAAPQADAYFGLYLLCALIILARMNLASMERMWRQAAIGYTSDVSWDIMGSGAIVAVLLLVAVWIFPASAPNSSWFAALDPLQAPWHSMEEQFTRAFSALRASTRPNPSAFTASVLSMGGPIHLGQHPVMDVRAANGRYFRAAVYDRYAEGTWASTHLDPMNLSANDPRLDTGLGYSRAEVTQTVKILLNDQNVLFGQSQPIRFSIPTEARVDVNKTETSSAIDLTLARARRPVSEGDAYTVVSEISGADEDSLRNDSTDYPSWIVASYLQLPESLPDRVRLLSKEITANLTNPYDRAVALERYLRTHITYNEQVSAPPPNVDGVDYLLFERPEGYCNYYASAMAVMARTLGIPARVASGYSLGDYKDSVFHIVESDAHAWVEVYFPSYGWIEFEPTATKPEIERPKKPAPGPQNPDTAESAEERRLRQERLNRTDEEDSQAFGSGRFTLPFWIDTNNVAWLAGAVALLLGLVAVLGRFWYLSQQKTRLPPAARTYEDMLERARWLGVRDPSHATPFERASSIRAALPESGLSTERIVSFYSFERFGARQLAPSERETLDDAWRNWRTAWWRGLGKQFVDKFTLPFRNLHAQLEIALEKWNRRQTIHTQVTDSESEFFHK